MSLRVHGLICALLTVLYASPTLGQQGTAGRAGNLDPASALKRQVSLSTNSATGLPICSQLTTREVPLTVAPPDNFTTGLPSENIVLDGKTCSAGKLFEFLKEIESPRASLRPGGYTTALTFMSGAFRAPSSASGDAGTSPPDDLDILVTALRSGQFAPKCGVVTLKRFFIMRPRKDFIIPVPVQNIGPDKRVIMRPNMLYFALDLEGTLSPTPVATPMSTDVVGDASLCVFGQTKTERETVATEGEDDDDEDSKKGGDDGSSGGGTPVAAIAAGVVGAVIGLLVILVASIAWRRRHAFDVSGESVEDGSVASSGEIPTPI